MKHIIIIILATLTFTSCNKLCSVAPMTFGFNIQDLDGNDLLDTSYQNAIPLDSIRFYYIENNTEKNLHFQVWDRLYMGNNYNFLYEFDLQEYAVNKGIQTYYLQLSTNEIYTFTIKASKNGRCANVHTVDEFKINNTDMLHTSSVDIGDKRFVVFLE
ncbi:MAG: hypothetical protein H6553_00685 [Chitinophagales bacterium]|nr:hypothetical protein [Chitinophagales bacterium]